MLPHHHRHVLLRVASVTALSALIIGCGPKDANGIIADAQSKLGNPNSITYSGTAKDVNFQQCGANQTAMSCQGMHNPMRPIADYVRVIDLAAPTTRHTGKTMNIGAGGSTAVTPGTFFQQVTAEQADVTQPWAQALDFYLTPWGFLKGAAANGATLKQETVDGKQMNVLSWSPKVTAPSGKNYVVNGYLNSDNLVERTETWVGENIMGDMHIVVDYSGWKDMGGAMAPSKIVQTRGGWPFFEADITAAKANPADLASLAPAPATKGGPGAPKAGGPAPTFMVTAEKLGDGIYRLTTGAGSYDSVLIEFADHVMMLEAGQSIPRAEAYVAKTKELFPNKPIRYVMNTHPHADHTGGLPALVAEGATIITHENNKEFLDKALNTPRTLLDDGLAKNPKPATVETVGEKKVYSDAKRTVEMYHVPGAPHSNGLIIAYLPKERILFQGDFSVNPGQPANDHVNALVPVLDKLALPYNRYINVHASAAPQTKSDVSKAMQMRAAANKG